MSMTDEQARQIARVIAWVEGDTFDDLPEAKQRTYLDSAQECAEDLGVA